MRRLPAGWRDYLGHPNQFYLATDRSKVSEARIPSGSRHSASVGLNTGTWQQSIPTRNSLLPPWYLYKGSVGRSGRPEDKPPFQKQVHVLAPSDSLITAYILPSMISYIKFNSTFSLLKLPGSADIHLCFQDASKHTMSSLVIQWVIHAHWNQLIWSYLHVRCWFTFPKSILLDVDQKEEIIHTSSMSSFRKVSFLLICDESTMGEWCGLIWYDAL